MHYDFTTQNNDEGAFIALKQLQDNNDKLVDDEEEIKELEKMFGKKTLAQILEAKNAPDENFIKIDWRKDME